MTWLILLILLVVILVVFWAIKTIKLIQAVWLQADLINLYEKTINDIRGKSTELLESMRSWDNIGIEEDEELGQIFTLVKEFIKDIDNSIGGINA